MLCKQEHEVAAFRRQLADAIVVGLVSCLSRRSAAPKRQLSRDDPGAEARHPVARLVVVASSVAKFLARAAQTRECAAVL